MKKDERQGEERRKLRCKANPKAKCFLRETIVAKIWRPTGCQAWRVSQTIGRWTVHESFLKRYSPEVGRANFNWPTFACLEFEPPLLQAIFELVALGICRGYFSLWKFWVPQIFFFRFTFRLASNFISKYIYIYNNFVRNNIPLYLEYF